MLTVTNKNIGVGSLPIRLALLIGRDAARGDRSARGALARARADCADMRGLYGFKAVASKILTAPEDQHKLALGVVSTYGITLHHYVFKSLFDGRVWNLCTSAGDCTKVCVLDNGNGGYDVVRRGWRWRTDLLLNKPFSFFVLLGWEIERAVIRDGRILCRPNVNSDIRWEILAPALVDGTVFGDAVKFYGYSKHADVLDGDGWLTPYYRVSYSFNEATDSARRVHDFLVRGGAVAIVTDRYYTTRTRQPIKQWSWLGEVVDADVSDEWMFTPGVVGDLSFKPRTSKLRAWGQDTNFVVKVYGKDGRMATFADVTETPVTVKPGRELVTA